MAKVGIASLVLRICECICIMCVYYAIYCELIHFVCS